MNDRFHYDALVDDALRSVVRRVLTQVAEKGLPGSHHFYISFRSTDPGVQLPDYLRAKYPEEMTIVLQHQYWDLILGANHFEVTVSFNKQQERIKVPFAALSAFVDPSVRFGLQFDRKDKAGDEGRGARRRRRRPLPPAEKRPPLGGARRLARPSPRTAPSRPRPSPRTPPPRSSSSTASERSRRAPPLRQGCAPRVSRSMTGNRAARRARRSHARVPVPGDVPAR